jgi:hypothetical protein
VLAIIAIAVSGCTSPGKADKPATHATLPARQAIKLAVSNVAAWRSDISTTTVSGTDAGGQISFALDAAGRLGVQRVDGDYLHA